MHVPKLESSGNATEILLEQKIESFSVEEVKEPEAEDTHIETDYGSSNIKVPGAFKKMFGKAKK